MFANQVPPLPHQVLLRLRGFVISIFPLNNARPRKVT